MGTNQRLSLFALVSAMTWPAAAQPANLNGPPNLVTNTVTLPPGWSLAANPLFHLRGTTLRDAVPDNTVAELFKQMPPGTVLLKFDNATQRFDRKTAFRHGRWSNPHETLAPGEGAFLFNPTRKPLAVAFTGNWWYGAVSIPVGLSLISSPGPGTIDFMPPAPPQTPPFGGPVVIYGEPGPPAVPPPVPFARSGVNFDPQEGDVVYTFDNASGRFHSHTFQNGAWDAPLVVGVGDACFVHTTKPRTLQSTVPRPV
ncbi:MAG: hypothetical protein DME22_23780 [Verrucomicrobia bacterium]|nr:MAG: hypothetical protein DME22_23780 [Verrucomicrobiota bacterium]